MNLDFNANINHVNMLVWYRKIIHFYHAINLSQIQQMRCTKSPVLQYDMMYHNYVEVKIKLCNNKKYDYISWIQKSRSNKGSNTTWF